MYRRLLEPHKLILGCDVVVTERRYPYVLYHGRVHSIVAKPIHSWNIDHVYVTFEEGIYASLLLRGSEIIYEGLPAIIGDIRIAPEGRIESATKQETYTMNETSIDPTKIHAMLVWRVAYDIHRV